MNLLINTSAGWMLHHYSKDMIEIKELIIRAVVDAKAEKPEANDTEGNTSISESDCAVCESIEQIMENLHNRNER